MIGTYQIEVVIVTDSDPGVSHQPKASLPLNLSRFGPAERVGSNARPIAGPIRVAWVPSAGGDVSITVGTGVYSIPTTGCSSMTCSRRSS